VPLGRPDARPTGSTAQLLELVRAQLEGKQGEEAASRTREQTRARLSARRSRARGAIAIRVDAARWPELFQRVDFNEQAPPGYAVLRLYCYDFKDGLRPELLFKKVDVEATAVGGRTVSLSTKFLRSQPDLYARSIALRAAGPARPALSLSRHDRPSRWDTGRGPLDRERILDADPGRDVSTGRSDSGAAACSRGESGGGNGMKLAAALTALLGLALAMPGAALVKYDEGGLIIDGVQLLQDANDELSYYYLPQYPRLATKEDGETLEFLCVKYVGQSGKAERRLFHALVEFTLPPRSRSR
jgi:hypothetical protein